MMDKQAAVEYRYERKFLVDQLDAHRVRAVILSHPAMFREAYPPRYVNNIYLDTPFWEHYTDNQAGADDRLKVRVRWYHDFFGPADAPVLEFKFKRGMVGSKEHYALPYFEIGAGLSDAMFKALVRSSPALPDDVRAYLLSLRIALFNRYHRAYYATHDGTFRVTIDTRLTWFGTHQLRNRFLHRQVDASNVIVELKYQAAHETRAERVASFFPFRVTRSSKYVQGMERVYGW